MSAADGRTDGRTYLLTGVGCLVLNVIKCMGQFWIDEDESNVRAGFDRGGGKFGGGCRGGEQPPGGEEGEREGMIAKLQIW